MGSVCARAGDAGTQPTDDLLTAHLELARGAPFCGNPDCALHVRLVDAAVEGAGNWISLPDGRMFGRGRFGHPLFGHTLLCDACGTRRGPVRIPATPHELKRWRARQ